MGALLAKPQETPLNETANFDSLSGLKTITADQVRAVGCEPVEEGLKVGDAMAPDSLVHTGTFFYWLMTNNEPLECYVPWTVFPSLK